MKVRKQIWKNFNFLFLHQNVSRIDQIPLNNVV